MKNNNGVNVRFLTQLALLVAIVLVMSYTPLGYLPLGPLNCSLLSIPVAIGAYADAEVLKSYYPDKDLQGEPLQKVVLKASKDAFRDIFQWLSTSISSVAKTTAPAGTPVTLPPVPESITISI